jgi:hypothetical protein
MKRDEYQKIIQPTPKTKPNSKYQKPIGTRRLIKDP